MRSLRLRLLLLIGTAILAAAAIQFMTSFQTAMRQANKLFDYHMQQMAFALQDNNFEQFEWTSWPDSPRNNFDFVIQVWAENGASVYQSRPYEALPEQAALGYSTVQLANGEWRIYALQAHAQKIQVVQKLQARENRALALVLNSLWPIIPASIFLFMAAWWVITSALAPLNRIGDDLGKRNVDSLEPVNETGVPLEVSPLLVKLNSLLARFAHTVHSQRQFVADAAHELRTPLTALKLQVQTLARAKDEAAKVQAIARLEGGVDRATRMVEQLLALARQDPLSPFVMSKVSLTDCTYQVIADVAPFAAAKQIQFRYGKLEQVDVFGDLESLRILLRNLVDNAVRYTPEHGTVEISIARYPTHVAVTIQDSGAGIPWPERARIFDRFYRVPGTNANGSGLGLAIVKAIAERHQATLKLEDAALGGLATTVLFPVDPHPPLAGQTRTVS